MLQMFALKENIGMISYKDVRVKLSRCLQRATLNTNL